MKKLFAILLLALLSAPSFAQTLAQSGLIDVNNTTSGVSSSFTSSIGDVLYVFIADNNATGTVSDSKGNTWTQVGTTNTIGVISGKRFYSVVSSAGTGHTITVMFTGVGNSTPVWSRITGADPAPIDATGSTQGTDGTSPFTLASGSLTQANNLLIGDIFCDGSAGNYTAGGGFSLFQQQVNDNLYWTQASAQLTTTTTAVQTESWTVSGSIGAGAGLFLTVFKAAGSPPAGLVVNPISGRGGPAAQPIVQ